MSRTLLGFSYCSARKVCLVQTSIIHLYRKFHTKRNLLLYSALRKPSLSNHLSVRYLTTYEYTSEYMKRVCDSDVVFFLQQKLTDFHDLTGLPWWAVIVLSTVMMRTVFILPLTIHQNYVISKLELINNDLFSTIKDEVAAEVRKLAEEKSWTERQVTKEYKSRLIQRKNELIIKHNCHPLKTILLIIVQMPIWISMSCAIRNLTYMYPLQDITAQIIHTEMKANSVLWMSDLTLPDSSYFLPFMVGLFNIGNIEVMKMSKIQKKSFLGKISIMLFYIVTTGMVYFATSVPKTVALYWATSSLYALIQNMLLLVPSVRKAVRLPILPNMRTKPLKFFFNRMKSLVYLFKY